MLGAKPDVTSLAGNRSASTDTTVCAPDTEFPEGSAAGTIDLTGVGSEELSRMP